MSSSDYTQGTGGPIEQQALQAAPYDPTRDPQQILEGLKEQVKAGPRYIPNTTVVDAVSLAKAQGRFIRAQADFLAHAHAYGTQEYADDLRRFNGAKDQYIDALQIALHQADVL